MARLARWLAVDTDAGVDDAFALALGLLWPSSPRLKLIMTSHGNTNLKQVNINVAKVRRACGFSRLSGPPICPGAAHALSGSAPIEASYFHGRDGLGDAAGIPDLPLGEDAETDREHGLEARPAAEALIELSHQAAAEQAGLSLVTLGPLTNLAIALDMDPSLPDRLESVVAMAGCGNARGNHSRVAEFNVAADPEAAEQVMRSFQDKSCAAGGPKLRLVSWELTLKHTLPWDQLDRWLYSPEADGPVAGFLASIGESAYGPGCADRGSTDGAVVCDALAMAVGLDPAIAVRAEPVAVEVELEGTATRGMTVVDWGCFDGVERPVCCDWVTAVDDRKYAEVMASMFSRS